MPETVTETATSTPSGTESASTGTQTQVQTQSQNSETTEHQSEYDRIIREYFGEISGEPSNENQSTENGSAGSNEVGRALNALGSELQSIKTQLAAAGQKPEKVDQETKDEFLDLYARGDKEGAKRALIQAMAPSIKAELSRSVSQDVIRATRAEQDIRDYSSRLRTDNPDLVPFERAISLEARDLVQHGMQHGMIKTVEEYVSASKKALQMTVDAYRKRTLALRGEGKTEAQTRQTQVVSSGAVAPGQINTERSSSSGSESQEPDVSAQSYLARRRELQRAGRGMA